MPLRPESSSGWVELERPQEVISLFEVGANAVNFVDKILSANNVLFSKSSLDDVVGRERDPLPLNFAETSLVDEPANGSS